MYYKSQKVPNSSSTQAGILFLPLGQIATPYIRNSFGHLRYHNVVHVMEMPYMQHAPHSTVLSIRYIIVGAFDT